jgi:hypothetical protein
MRRIYYLSAALALWAAMAGCGDPKHPAALVGRWNVTDLRSESGQPAPPQVRQRLQANPTMVILNADGTASQAIGSRKTSGKWSVNPGRLSITYSPSQNPETEPGHPYHLENGGRTLVIAPAGRARLSMVLTKQ